MFGSHHTFGAPVSKYTLIPRFPTTILTWWYFWTSDIVTKKSKGSLIRILPNLETNECICEPALITFTVIIRLFGVEVDLRIYEESTIYCKSAGLFLLRLCRLTWPAPVAIEPSTAFHGCSPPKVRKVHPFFLSCDWQVEWWDILVLRMLLEGFWDYIT